MLTILIEYQSVESRGKSLWVTLTTHLKKKPTHCRWTGWFLMRSSLFGHGTPQWAVMSAMFEQYSMGPFGLGLNKVRRAAQIKKNVLSVKFASLRTVEPSFHLLHYACFWYSPVACLSWKSRGNLVVKPVFFYQERGSMLSKLIVVLSSSKKRGHGCLYRLGYIDWKTSHSKQTCVCEQNMAVCFHIRLVSSCSDRSWDQWHLLSNNTWQCPGGIDQSTHTLRDGLADGPLYGM